MNTNTVKESWKEYNSLCRLTNEIPSKEGIERFYNLKTTTRLEELVSRKWEVQRLIEKQQEGKNMNPYKIENKIRENIDIIFSLNKPREKELKKINDLTTIRGITLTKEQLYKELVAEFNRAGALYHFAASAYERYRTLRELYEGKNKKIKLQIIPIFDEPNLDNVTRKYAEKLDREYVKDRERDSKFEKEKNIALDKVLRIAGLSLEQIRGMKR